MTSVAGAAQKQSTQLTAGSRDDYSPDLLSCLEVACSGSNPKHPASAHQYSKFVKERCRHIACNHRSILGVIMMGGSSSGADQLLQHPCGGLFLEQLCRHSPEQ